MLILATTGKALITLCCINALLFSFFYTFALLTYFSAFNQAFTHARVSPSWASCFAKKYVSARAPDMKDKTTPAAKPPTTPKLTFQEVMLKYFPPAAKEHIVAQLTTIEIFEKLQEFYPGAYSCDDVFQLLHENYQSQSIGGMDRVWLVGNVL